MTKTDPNHAERFLQAMDDSTQADWMKIAAAAKALNGELADRVLHAPQMLKGADFPVDRLEHPPAGTLRTHGAKSHGKAEAFRLPRGEQQIKLK